MNKVIAKYLRKRFVSASGCLILFFSFCAVCNAGSIDCSGAKAGDDYTKCQLSKYLSVDVTTSDLTKGGSNYGPAGWYNSDYGNNNPFNNFVICNYDKNGTNTHNWPFSPTNPFPCNTVSTDRSYYFTDDLDDETNINTPEKNFTIHIDDPEASRIMIDWVNRPADDLPDKEAGWSGGTLNGSYTCPLGSSCDICIEGGSCDNPAIPADALSTLPDGSQNTFWFRVTVTDSSGTNSITTGSKASFSGADKEYLDKYYKFVICGPKCGGCSAKAPSVTNLADSCDSSGNHIVSWQFKPGAGGGSGQRNFIVEAQEISSDDPNLNYMETNEGIGSASYLWSYLNIYEDYRWRVKVIDNNSTTSCQMWSTWSDWQNMTSCKPAACPSSYDIDISCPSGYPNCKFGENINFVTGAPDSLVSYYGWLEDGTPISGTNQADYYNYASISKKYTKTDDSFNIGLVLTMKDGSKCIAPEKVLDFSTDYYGDCSVLDFITDPTTNQYYDDPITFACTSYWETFKWSKIVGGKEETIGSAPVFSYTFKNTDGANPIVKLDAVHDGTSCTKQKILSLSAPSVGACKNFNFSPDCDPACSDTGPNPCLQNKPITFTASGPAGFDPKTCPSCYTWWVESAPAVKSTGLTFAHSFPGNDIVHVDFNDGTGDKCSSSKPISPKSGSGGCTAAFTYDCVSGSTCRFNKNVTFTATSTASKPQYEWTVDSVIDTDNTNPAGDVLAEKWSSGKTHVVSLKVTDKNTGALCTIDPASVTLDLKGNADWNEIAPFLTSTGFSLMILFFARLIILYIL